MILLLWRLWRRYSNVDIIRRIRECVHAVGH